MNFFIRRRKFVYLCIILLIIYMLDLALLLYHRVPAHDSVLEIKALSEQKTVTEQPVLKWNERLLEDVPLFDISNYIHVQTLSQAEAKRRELYTLIWGREHLPNSFDHVTTLGATTAYPLPSTEYRIEMPGSVDSIVRVFEQYEEAPCLTLYHDGHTPVDLGATYKNIITALYETGCDVAWFNMPLEGGNAQPLIEHPQFGRIRLTGHEQLQVVTTADFSYLRFFLDPIVEMLNFLESQNNYQFIAMAGHSGGGWTTTVYAALDPRIQVSYPIAGSLPLFLSGVKPEKAWGDFEQHYMPLLMRTNYLDLYVMGTTGGRHQMQILNRYDNCCFAGIASKIYVDEVSAAAQQVGGTFTQFIDEENPDHSVSPRQQELIRQHLEQQLTTIKYPKP